MCLLESGGSAVKQYSSGPEFLAKSCPCEEDVNSIDMPGLDGFAVQHTLAGKGIGNPVILTTGSAGLRFIGIEGGGERFHAETI